MSELNDLFPYSIFILGTIIGSFVNVAALRYLSGESVVWPGSKCPACQVPIAWYDNVPILSWLILRGRCRKCRGGISYQYPIVEFLLGSLFLATYLKFGPTWTMVEVLVLLTGLVIVSLIDLKSYLLPDIYTLPGIGLGLLGAWLNPERSFGNALAGVVLGAGFLWALSYAYYLWRKQEGLGGGDIKLLAWMGAVLGWESLPFIMLAASIVGSIAGLWTMRSSQKGFKTMIPFGPYLALGSVAYIFFAEYFARKYAEFLFPFLF